MKNISKLVAAALMCCALTAQAASVALGKGSNSNISITITPDSTESGTAYVYMAAVFNGNVFFRGTGGTGDWKPYTSGAYPYATSFRLSGAAQTLTVVDFDISSLPGLEVYVGYGTSQNDLSKSGHLSKVYTVTASTGTGGSGSSGSGSSGGSTITGADYCDSTQAPAGVSYSASGNTVNITTNGQCVGIPTSSALCTPKQVTTSSVSSVLTTVNISSFSLTGITLNIPGMANPFTSLAQGLGAVKTCVKNAPAGYSTISANIDVCYDITSALGSSLTAYSSNPYITISSPITEKLKGSISSTTVSDCFATDATTVVDAKTQELWIKQGSSFTKIH